jgi:hypothetical protein
MYWDVVEVEPRPDHRLFVRFKDGLTGLVRLTPEELIGVLAPLCDEHFFRQVFIDHGAVTWPGEIDLAPDAMHADLTAQRDAALTPGNPSILEYALAHLEKERDEIQTRIHSVRGQLSKGANGNSSKMTRADAGVKSSLLKGRVAVALAEKQTKAQKAQRGESRDRTDRKHA